MSVAELPVAIDPESVAVFCRARGIRKLSLFGSVLRDDFDSARSDVDVLVEFCPGVRPGFRFFGYGDELGGILGREVDLLTPAMLSPHFRDEAAAETRQVLTLDYDQCA